MIGHRELVFNENKRKAFQFEVDSAQSWQVAERDGCWVCQKWKYTVVFVDRSKYNNHFSEVTDPKVIEYIRREYKLDEPDLLISKNTRNPTIMGSITKFTACQTVKAATYSLCLANDLPWFG